MGCCLGNQFQNPPHSPFFPIPWGGGIHRRGQPNRCCMLSPLMSELSCLVIWVIVGGEGVDCFFFLRTASGASGKRRGRVLAPCSPVVPLPFKKKSPVSQLPHQKELLRTVRVDQEPHPSEMTVSLGSMAYWG